MTTANLHRPAKVAPVGARRPLMQDENSGKDGRRFNEWLANRSDSRRRAREAAEEISNRHPEPQDPAIKTKTDIAAVLFVWVGGIFLGLGLISLAASLAR